MIKVKHISFDLDGTLINSFPIMKQAWAETMLELGLAVGFDSYKKYIGIPFRNIINNLSLSGVKNEIEILYFSKTKKLSNQIKLTEYAKEILFWCKKSGFSTSIITSKPRKNAELIILEKKLEVDILICGDDMKGFKPYPDPGLKILDKLNLSANDVLYIGDMIYDLQFSQNLGAHFFHFSNYEENMLPSNLVNNVKTISNLMEIKELIKLT